MDINDVVAHMSKREIDMQQEKLDKLDKIIKLLEAMNGKLDEVVQHLDLIEEHKNSVADKR